MHRSKLPTVESEADFTEASGTGGAGDSDEEEDSEAGLMKLLVLTLFDDPFVIPSSSPEW